jgi:uncharacterized membrane protein
MSRRGNPHSPPGSLEHRSLPADSHDEREQHFPYEHRRGLLPEKYFRWRAGEITRLEGFCDVVFGFALTLLVVSLEVPHTYGELMAVMRGFLAFGACFAQLVLIWRSHYKFSRRYGLEDPYTVFLNVVLLFLVLFYVYPLKFVFSTLFAEVMGTDIPGGLGFHEASVLMRIYGIGFTGVFTLFVLLYARAYTLRQELQLNLVEVYETRLALQENGLLSAIGIISFCVAFKSPAGAGWIYMGIGIFLWIHGSVFGKRARLLAEKMKISAP